eukprot:IDg5723t1
MSNQNLTKLGMKQNVQDICLFYKEEAAKRFECEAKSGKRPALFCFVLIDGADAVLEVSLTLPQFIYTAGIETMMLDATAEDFSNSRGKLTYEVFASHPDLAFHSAQLSQLNAEIFSRKIS